MTIQNLGGGFSLIGPMPFLGNSGWTDDGVTMNTAKYAAIFIGRVVTADGGSHTIDTTGSSKLSFLTGSVTFASGSSTCVVGLAAVDFSNGPAGRAVNVSDVITPDVSASLTGGGGGITGSAWQNITPTSGSKTIANGDLVAFFVQLTARGGTDVINVNYPYTQIQLNRPLVTTYTGGYVGRQRVPNCLITFSDGTLGWIDGGDVHSAYSSRTWGNGGTTKEYGQLYNLPFAYDIIGVYGHVNISNDVDIILYSDPLGTPTSRKSISFDVNTAAGGGLGNGLREMFPSAYSVPANTPIVVACKPTTVSTVALSYKTLANAAHRATDPWGTSGYGVNRASGAFADDNSGLNHYDLGLIIKGYDGGGIIYPRSGLQGITEGISR